MENSNITQAEFTKKVENRLLGVKTLDAGKSSYGDNNGKKIFARMSNGERTSEEIFELMSENLSEAQACSIIDGYGFIMSPRPIIGRVIVILKKGIRKLIKICFGWYIFPIYNKITHFHGKVINVMNLQKEGMQQLERILQETRASLEETRASLNDANSLLELMKNIPSKDPMFYHEFEEKFRGSREDIRDRLMDYVPRIKAVLPEWKELTFVDVGSGRGEWLDILKDNYVKDYVGVDLNEVQNKVANEYGHKTILEDCVTYLEGLESDSVDVITGFQIVEHLYAATLNKLLEECYRVIRKNGVVLFETPNSKNIMVGSSTFYTDQDHNRPIHPELLKFLVEYAGFESEIIERNSHEKWSGVELPATNSEYYDLTKEFNEICWLMYGPMDYAIIGVKK